MGYRPLVNRIPPGYIFKKSQFAEEDIERGFTTPDIVVEPYEPIIQEVVNELKSANSGIFDTVSKIRVDSSENAFGFVNSENPNVININWNNILNEFNNQVGVPFNPVDESHKQAIKEMVSEVIVHEKAHVDDAVSAQSGSTEQILGGEDLFPGGEQVAEQATQQFNQSRSNV